MYKAGTLPPTFDARVFQVPTLAEGANAFLWRQRDARRNAISMVGRHHFSHGQLMNLSTQTILELLESQRDVDFDNDFPWQNRHGVFIHRESVMRHLTDEELARIPKDRQPTEPVQRSCYVRFDLPLLSERKMMSPHHRDCIPVETA